jgi:YD repeat-containing protein
LNLVVNGALHRVQPASPGFSVAEYVVASEDGGELYAFDAMGRHQRTVDALTGATRYRFGYDPEHRLITVTDLDGNLTAIERDGAGNPTAIVGPYGHRTSLSVDGNGYLASVSTPASETVQLGSTTEGLLTSYRDPRGSLYQYAYDVAGFLERDQDPAGGVQTLSRTFAAGGYEVTRSTIEGRTTTYEVADLASGVVRREVSDPAGLVTRSERGTNDAVTTTTPEGTVASTVEGPDPRFGMQAPVLKNLTVAIPGGLTSTVTGSRQITGFSGSHPLGIAGVEERVTVNGRQYVSAFDALANRFTDVTPMGRQTITRVDSAGRPLAVRVAGLDSVVYGYDLRGRLATSRQGGRQWSYAYDDSGRLARITDPLSRVTEFGYDAADRLVRQVLPDLSEIRYGYDANGNLTSLTPPGRPNHGFEYTAVDLTERYAPPDVGLPEERTSYAYNRDRQLEAITRPDGVVVDLGYDGAGRLSSVAIPRGTIGFGYSPTSGNLTSLTSPDGVSLSYSYNGSLPIQESWSGAVSGSVSLTYDNNLRPVSQSVNGANTVSFGYDNDGLLTAAGALTLTRNAANGLLTGTTLGSLTTSQSYTSAGELATFDAKYAGASVFDTAYNRDSLGRITRLTETVPVDIHGRPRGRSQPGRLPRRPLEWPVHLLSGAARLSAPYTGVSGRLRSQAVFAHLRRPLLP